MPPGWTGKRDPDVLEGHPAADQAGDRRWSRSSRRSGPGTSSCCHSSTCRTIEVPARRGPRVLHQGTRRRYNLLMAAATSGRAAGRRRLPARAAILHRGRHGRRGEGLTPNVATVAGQPIPSASSRSGSPGCAWGHAGAICRRPARPAIRSSPLGRPGARDGGDHHARNPRVMGSSEVSQLVLAVTEDVVVAEEDTRSYYDRNQDLYRRPLSVIRTKTPERRSRRNSWLPHVAERSTSGSRGGARQLAVVEPGYEHPADPRYGFPSHRH